ncbi:MAG: J domain-containing protein [Proteobacteria bacterium]|nr:J domain-containing protein [Pseudomonadota bacterium]
MAVESRNYYELLGVPRNASKEQIRDAYKELARIYHPDSHFYDEILEGLSGAAAPQPAESEIFKLITEAYNTLSNEKSREEYNRIIPGDLPQWEQNNRDEWHAEHRGASFQGLGTGRRATTAFGNVAGDKTRSAFDEDALRATRSVSELIKMRRRLWWKIRWLFFLEN